MKYGVRRRQGAKPEPPSFWICFSDLMSALLLMFVLVLFYSAYQYFDMLEIKTAELTRQSGLLDDQQAQLASSQETLKQKESELNDKSQKLTQAEQELITQKAKLLLQEDSLNSLQAKLDEQETELTQAQTSLDQATQSQQAQQQKLDEQQALLDSQQSQLKSQQDILQNQSNTLKEQQSQLADQRQQLEKLVGVRADIISQLIGALSEKNITGAKVDASGAIVFDSEMMFDKNESVLKDEGKAFLRAFIPGYLDVLLSSENRQYVSQIIVEGHTDTDGTFSHNMELSQQRAGAVLSYVLSDEFGAITPLAKRRLQEIVTVNGRSYSDPVYNAETGQVDKDASRRVVIKFRLNDEDMVNEMIDLLNGM